MTAGVPSKSKKAALVQIANRQEIQVTASENQASPVISRTAGDTNKQAQRDGVIEIRARFDAGHVMKAHKLGASLAKIHEFASKKYGSIETSKAIRNFVAGLVKKDGKIVMAKKDVEFLASMGIRGTALVPAKKCASCEHHIKVKAHKVSKALAPNIVLATSSPTQLRTDQVKEAAVFDSKTITQLHTAGKSLDAIYKEGINKVGSTSASRAIKTWVGEIKRGHLKIALSQIDCTLLKNKLGTQNVIVGAEKCGSCTYRKDMHCGLTGGTLLSFPGMEKQATNHKVAANAPKDGRATLNEYDLVTTNQPDIEMNPPERLEVEMGSKPKVNL